MPPISKTSVAAQEVKMVPSLRIEFQIGGVTEKRKVWFLRFRNLQPRFWLKKINVIRNSCLLFYNGFLKPHYTEIDKNVSVTYPYLIQSPVCLPVWVKNCF